MKIHSTRVWNEMNCVVACTKGGVDNSNVYIVTSTYVCVLLMLRLASCVCMLYWRWCSSVHLQKQTLNIGNCNLIIRQWNRNVLSKYVMRNGRW